jgi:hypothetical protein
MLPIEFLILYPMSLPVAFLLSKLWAKISRKRYVDTPEATPYEFEKDKPVKNYNQVMNHIHCETKRMYRGKLLS